MQTGLFCQVAVIQRWSLGQVWLYTKFANISNYCHLSGLLYSRMKIMAFYDRSFKEKFGKNSVGVIQNVLSHTQNHFNWPSLTTKIKLTLVLFYCSIQFQRTCVKNYGTQMLNHVSKYNFMFITKIVFTNKKHL